ncbi:hypothetical protein [Amycolatopsis sp. NPDC051071]|uniref:hypothetical protein n=1 Tax=Amycolatopsis sp. NPDC051071 TaxID=3154637 RepID=UPI00343E37BB
MEEVKTYHAEVTRDGKFWLIRVREIGRSTQALRCKDVETMASDLIEIMENIRGDEYDLHLKVHLPNSVTDRFSACLSSASASWRSRPDPSAHVDFRPTCE